MSRLQLVGFELLAVLAVDYPTSAGFNVFPRRHRGRTADDRDEVLPSFHQHPQHGESTLGIMKGNSFDQSIDVFRHGCRYLTALYGHPLQVNYFPGHPPSSVEDFICQMAQMSQSA